MEKSPDAFRTISEVAEWLDTPAHVLRFWESRFTQVKPVKRAGGRRYYRPADMLLLGGIKKLLHEDGLTIRGVQKILREQGVKHVASLSAPLEDGQTIEAPMAQDVDEPASLDNVVPLKAAPEKAKDAPDISQGGELAAPKETDAPATGTTEHPDQDGGQDAVTMDEDPAPAADEEPPPEPTAPEVHPEPGAGAKAGQERPRASADPPPDNAVQPELALDRQDAPPPKPPEPLGADLPQDDPGDDDAGPLPAPLIARLRDPALRRRLHDTHRPALARILTRMEALASRMSDDA